MGKRVFASITPVLAVAGRTRSAIKFMLKYIPSVVILKGSFMGGSVSFGSSMYERCY